jgi:ribonuclease HI
MFQQRLYNPYENMPCLEDNTFYLVNTAGELLSDLKKCITLFEVSQYLTTKVEETWKEYQIQRQLKPTKKSIYNRLVSNQIDEIKQKKYERNLKVMKDHCGQY